MRSFASSKRVIMYKRLETGSFAELDRDEINARELYLLLEGIEVVRQPCAVLATTSPIRAAACSNSPPANGSA
jgi:hypothetical protein